MPESPLPRPARPIPEGYTEDVHPRGRVVAWEGAAEWSFDLLAGSTLHAWAADQPERTEFQGRGPVFAVPAPVAGPDGRARWAIRHYRRGGAMAMHMEDRYLRVGRARPFRELSASAAARARGVQTPAVVTGATYNDGLYYRCDLVTEVVPGVRTLADDLQEHDGTRGWLVAMARAGALIRSLAEAGIFHVDLTARNVLLSPDESEAAWVVDLDRARVLAKASVAVAERMQVRLIRSIIKIGTPTGEHLRDSEVEAALNTPISAL